MEITQHYKELKVFQADLLDKAHTLTEDNIKEKFQKEINQTMDLEDPCLTLVFFGETCSGKTTLINSVISLLIEDCESDQMSEKYKILPTSSTENTFQFYLIEPSIDDKFYLKIRDRSSTKVLSTDLDEIKKILKEDDSLATDILNIVKNNKKGLSDSQFDDEVETYKIYSEKTSEVKIIEIPRMKFPIKIIDSPGVSASKLESLIQNCDFLDYPIFVYVKNLDSEQATNEKLLNIMNHMSEKFKDTLFFSFIFTKTDNLLDVKLKGSIYNPDDNEDDFSIQWGKNISSFLNFIDSNKSRIIDAQFVNPKFLFHKNKIEKENNKKNLLQFLMNINHIKTSFSQYYKFEKIKNILLLSLNEISNFKGERLLNEDDVQILHEKTEKSKFNFSLDFATKIKSFEKFTLNYPDMYKEIKKKLQENDQTTFKEIYFFNKCKYIMCQIDSTKDYFNEKFNNLLYYFIEESLYNTFNYLDHNIRLKISEILKTIEREEIETKDISFRLIKIGLLKLNKEMFLKSKIEYLKKWPNFNTLLSKMIFPLDFFLPPYVYLGLWSREECYVEIIEAFINSLLKCSEKLIAEICFSYNLVIDTIVNFLRIATQKEKEYFDLKEYIEKYELKFDEKLALFENLNKAFL
jgi:hypothetical protein